MEKSEEKRGKLVKRIQCVPFLKDKDSYFVGCMTNPLEGINGYKNSGVSYSDVK